MCGIQISLDAELLNDGRSVHMIPFHLRPHRRSYRQWHRVRRIECSKVIRRDFRRSISPKELIVKVQTHFRNHKMSRDDQGPK